MLMILNANDLEAKHFGAQITAPDNDFLGSPLRYD